MKARKTVAMVIVLSMLSSAAVSAQEAHHHDWIDDVAASTQTTNAYYCNCGATKCEDISSIRDYTITFDANGGIVEEPIRTTKDGKIKLPLAYRGSDYQFDGWFTANGEEVVPDFVFEADTILYARWSVVAVCTLIFATDGGSDLTPIIGKYGETISLASYVPTKSGYIFEGWYADPRQKLEWVTEFTFSSDGVVYARWRDDGTVKRKEQTAQQYSGEVDGKTGAHVTALWVQQQEALRRLMEIYNSIFE